MIVAVCVSINEIQEKGRDFPWPRPDHCPKCLGERLWFHGFVLALFDGLAMGVWLRRVRCPDCKGVHRMTPGGYFRRFQAPVAMVRACIVMRVETGRWPSGLSRQRQGHWLAALKKKTLAYLGLEWMRSMGEAFDSLIWKEQIPASRSLKTKFHSSETYPTQ